MRNSSQRGFYSSQNNRSVGIKLFQNFGVNNGWIIRTKTCLIVWCISIIATQTFRGSVMIYHGIHTAGCNSEKQSRTPKFLEIPKIVLPIWLRQNGYFIAIMLQNSPNYSHSETRMINIRIACNQYNINLRPPSFENFVFGNR
jgi:hypothetical protein